MVKRSESAFEVHFYHCVKVVLGEREDHAVAQDACVVDEDVYVAVSVYGLADHGFGLPEVAHIGPVYFGSAAGGSDFVHHFLCGRDVGACAVLVAAQVIDDYRRSVMSEHQSVLFADASPRPRDDCHLAFAEFCHFFAPVILIFVAGLCFSFVVQLRVSALWFNQFIAYYDKHGLRWVRGWVLYAEFTAEFAADCGGETEFAADCGGCA